MGTRPSPCQGAAAAADGDGAWEARTDPRLTQTCSDTPATVRLHRGSLLTTLQPTKRQPATIGEHIYAERVCQPLELTVTGRVVVCIAVEEQKQVS